MKSTTHQLNDQATIQSDIESDMPKKPREGGKSDIAGRAPELQDLNQLIRRKSKPEQHAPEHNIGDQQQAVSILNSSDTVRNRQSFQRPNRVSMARTQLQFSKRSSSIP